MSQLIAQIIEQIAQIANEFWQNFFYANISIWQLGLDLLLVSIIFYYIFSLLKGSRSISVILGLLLINILFLISKNLNLLAMGWLLEKFMTMIIIAVPVIFQQELRMALEKLGKYPFLTHDKLSQDEKLIKILVQTCFDLAEKKIGALIVIQHDIPLKDQLETGVSLNATISEELLKTIFQPKSALHDGAVIISRNSILAARCILPGITDQRHKDLGTRHKAAIGLSDHTDADIIVVSEERGIVSFAKQGHLERNISPDKLRILLTKTLIHLKQKHAKSL